jgi:exopolysaccharide biosynthesis polyprenyl glycosylphosphotransferase
MSDNSSGGLGAGESSVGPSQQPPPRSYGLRIWPRRARARSDGIPQAAVGLWGVGRRLRNRLVGDSLQRAEHASGSAGFATTLNSVVDLCVLLISISIATMLSVSERPVEISFPEFVFTTFAAGLVWVIACAVLRHYDLRAFEREAVEDGCLVSVMVIGLAIFLGLLHLVLPDSAAIPKASHFLLVFWPGVLVLRLFVFRVLSENQIAKQEALIVGIGALGRLTGEDLEKRGRHRVVGYLEFPDESRSALLGSRLLGTSSDLEAVLQTTPVSEVFIAGDPLKQADAMQAAIRVCETFGMPFAIPAHLFPFERARPVAKAAIADGYLHYRSVGIKPYQLAVKRLFDILWSAAALTVLMPLFVVLAILIKLTSSGPVFFRQVRVGLHGKPFQMFKFRSMISNAEQLKALLAKHNERTGPVFKMRNDPRITRVGSFMRRFSLDELPQLINVLRGDMSVVGPRPPVPSEVALYEPWQRRRFSMRPGLTCIWQSSPNRDRIPFDQWMYLDMQYIDHWSLARDFALICKTLPVVVTGAGER